MVKKYELKTLKDIYDKVPLHRIEDCMKEITQLMLQCKTIEVAMKGYAHVTTGNAENATTYWPEPITWIDDGKGEIKAKVSINGEHVGTVDCAP